MIGVYYYPEQWPQEQWQRDIKNIKKMGMKHVHMAEFSWIHLEPEEGTYDFDWLDHAIALAKESELKVILCTPTATPPVWMSASYPEILMVKENGRKVTHGSRAQRCVNSSEFNRFSEGITHKMGERYGHKTEVSGWQIDNEVGHYTGAPCYCNSCHLAFIQYLEQRYLTITGLNKAWGGDFWSQNYQSFAQIQLPNPECLPYIPNEHALLDFKRFYSISLAKFLERQQKILKQYIHKKAWITHNFMKDDPWFFPGHIKEQLDLYTLSLYPVAGLYNGKPGRELHRIGDPYSISFNHDSARSFNNNWGVMEQQPGQVNWGPCNLRPYPGSTRLWLWTAIANGASLLDSYRYRQPLAGAEQYHEGMTGLDGVTLTSGGQNFAETAAEIEQLKHLFEEKGPEKQIKAALLVDWDSITAINIHPQSDQFNGFNCLNRFYRAQKRLSCSVDIIYTGQKKDLTKYDILCIGLVDLTDDAQIAEWKSYADQGGHLIISPHSATRNKNGHFPETQYGQRITDLTGARVNGYDMIQKGDTGKIKLVQSDTTIQWSRWAEQFQITEQSEPLALFSDQFYKGQVAAFKTKSGKGTITCIGFDQTEGIDQLVSESMKKEIPGLLTLPENSLFMIRGRLGIFLNYNDMPVMIPEKLKYGFKIVAGTELVAPADICLLEYQS